MKYTPHVNYHKNTSHFTVFRYCLILLASCLLTQRSYAFPVSELNQNETIVFFNTSAWFNSNTKQWHIPIHGWVYEPESSVARKALFAASFKTLYDLETDDQTISNFSNRINLFLADSQRAKKVVIRMAGLTFSLPESAPNGHFSQTLVLDESVINTSRHKQRLSFQAVLPLQDNRQFTGHVNLISPTGVSIISDIDDTIKISGVIDKKQLLKHTFYLDFKAVPGTADLYKKWLSTSGALHFVSSSPWQLYPPLKQFIEQAGFPSADYSLKYFRFKDSSFFNLFNNGIETKPPQIINILKKYPLRKFILIGDSGEQDPEIYAQIKQQFSDQIIHIFIRNVTGENANNARFKNAFKNIKPEQWQLYESVSDINTEEGAY